MAQKKGQDGDQGTPAGAPASKMDAVRRSLAKLGRKAKPLAIRDDIKKSFNMDLSTDLISTYKGEIGRKKGKGKKKKAKAQKAAAAGAPAKPVGRPAVRASVSLEDMRTVKAL